MDAIADVDEAAFAEGLQQGRKCALEGCSAAALSIAGRRHAEYIGHVGSLQAWGMQGWVEGQQDGLQKGIGIGTCLHLSLSLRRTVILVPALHYQEVCPEFGWCS